jgi:hypothetical protein
MTAAAIIAKAISDIREAVAAGDFSCRCCPADGDANIRTLLAAYDSLADGSAVRQAKQREAEAIARAGDAEQRAAAAETDRCDLREQLNEMGMQRDNAREDLASLLDDAAAVVRAMEDGDRAMDGRLFDDDARDLDGVIRTLRDNGRDGWWRGTKGEMVPSQAKVVAKIIAADERERDEARLTDRVAALEAAATSAGWRDMGFL